MRICIYYSKFFSDNMYKYYIHIYLCFNTCLLFRSLSLSGGRSRDNHLHSDSSALLPPHAIPVSTYVYFTRTTGVVRSVTATRALANYALRQWHGRKRADAQERRRLQCFASEPEDGLRRRCTAVYCGKLTKNINNNFTQRIKKKKTGTSN